MRILFIGNLSNVFVNALSLKVNSLQPYCVKIADKMTGGIYDLEYVSNPKIALSRKIASNKSITKFFFIFRSLFKLFFQFVFKKFDVYHIHFVEPYYIVIIPKTTHKNLNTVEF